MAVVEVEFPQASVAVKVTAVAPVVPQPSPTASKLFDHDTVPHASDATAPPFDMSQSLSSASFPSPSHSAVKSCAASTLGAVVSSIVNVAVVLTLFPQSSMAVNVTVAVPVKPHSSDNASKSLDHVMPLHASKLPLLHSMLAMYQCLHCFLVHRIPQFRRLQLTTVLVQLSR